MGKKQVEVFFDYVCPFCYRGLKYIEEIKDDFPNIEFIYRPSEANPSDDYEIVYDDEINRHLADLLIQDNIEYQIPVSPIPSSKLAMQAFNYIKDNKGDINKFTNNMYQAMFVEQKNIGNKDVILTCAKDTNIDLIKLEDELDNVNYDKKRQLDLEYAYISNNIEYIPTLIFKDKRLNASAGVGYSKQELIDYLNTL